MSAPLPQVQSLRDAVLEVINQPHGKPATRFVSATQYGNAPNLVQVCTSLILNPEAVAYRERELKDYPDLLTIEDFVCRHGSAWGFNQMTIQTVCGYAQHYDDIAGHTRYA